MTLSTESTHAPRPPFWLGFLVCAAVIALLAWLRLDVFANKLLPLSTGLPLLLVLWNKDLRLLYGMAIAITIVSVLKISWSLPSNAVPLPHPALNLSLLLVNIWLVAGVVHGILHASQRARIATAKLQHALAELEEQNTRLETTNHELSAREEEIARQNEELQCQTEELEQQAEELRQQAEELEQQSLRLQDANTELLRRETGLQTLLDTGRWLRGDLDETHVVIGICQASAEVLGGEISGVAISENREENYSLHAGSGFHIAPPDHDFPFSDSFAALVMESDRTACIEDLQLRPDLLSPPSTTGFTHRSVLATPIHLDGKPAAVLEIYSPQPRDWSDQEFRIAEWLAAQAALALQAIHFHRELEVRRSAAEDASRHKTRFLAAVSHDVRTPANAICLSAELIERIASDPAQRDLVPTMAKNLRSNARSLVELVSDVLDLTRFDAGRVDLQLSEFSLAALIASEVKIAMPLASGKGIVLESSPPEPDVHLRTDRMKLARVLSNIIGNAVKFTDHGGIRLLCEHTGTGALNIHIADTGHGIPETNLPHIFDEFFQLRNPERDHEKGTGLGLAICRRLLDAIGCQVSVRSEVGIGTTFTIHIPSALILGGNDQPAPASTPELPAPAPLPALENENQDFALPPSFPLRGLRLLLVEDHDVTRSTLAQLLSADGAIITEARNGREALHHLASGNHRVMLLDLNLPDIDGTEVLKSIQNNRPDGLKCVLVVSGDTRPERIEEVRRLGADNLIPKPISIENIVESLTHQCSDL